MNEFTCIECQFDTYKSIYTKGIPCTKIPFKKAKSVRLLKCTFVKGVVLNHNIFSAFVLFQRAWKRRRAFLRNPRRILSRELYGIPIRPPPFLAGLL